MIPSIPQSSFLLTAYRVYVGLFFVYLAAPLVVVSVFAFNDSLFPSPPWDGFTWDWFFGDSAPRVGLFHDGPLLKAIGVSVLVAVFVTLLSVAVGTSNAFLFEREAFPLKNFAYVLMLTPLVVPGIILGISILVMTNGVANRVYDGFGIEVEALRPGLILVVLGQFSFIATIATLVISAPIGQVTSSGAISSVHSC